MQNLNFKMENEILKFKTSGIFYAKKKVAKIGSKIYQKRKSKDSPRNFRFKRTGKENSRAL
jgi:hypothetical protein